MPTPGGTRAALAAALALAILCPTQLAVASAFPDRKGFVDFEPDLGHLMASMEQASEDGAGHPCGTGSSCRKLTQTSAVPQFTLAPSVGAVDTALSEGLTSSPPSYARLETNLITTLQTAAKASTADGRNNLVEAAATAIAESIGFLGENNNIAHADALATAVKNALNKIYVDSTLANRNLVLKWWYWHYWNGLHRWWCGCRWWFYRRYWWWVFIYW